MKARKSGGRPTRAEAEAIEARLLDGARLVFCRKGVANSSLEEIAATLGISKHTIYRRYPHKAALLEAVVERDIQQFRDALSSAAAMSKDPLKSLQRTALRYFEFGSSRDYSAFYLSVCAEAAFSPDLRKRLGDWAKISLEPLVEAIVAAQSAGDLKPANPSIVCEILVDLLEGANNRVRLQDESAPDRRTPRQLFNQRWTVFLAATATGTGSSAP
ncbi:TetR/AcrR family transcriptional regulator [Planctomicrobium sp. SH661]|uniref:TetR/AcrR family transcriptional regulator n=1 Tax=Planctomicrobium sp. SH661 TaxID=3448124 RepID=UPI003F5BFCB9